VPERHTELLEIDLGQLRQDIGVDVTRAKERLVLSEAETSQPTPDIHGHTSRARTDHPSVEAPCPGAGSLRTAVGHEDPTALPVSRWVSGRTSVRSNRGSVRNRRNLVVTAHYGEGPFTVPFADLAHRIANRWFFLVHDLCPAKPPEGKLDGGEGHEGGLGFGRVPQNSRFCPNQEKASYLLLFLFEQ